jgi:hypothetical protein
MWRFKPDGIYTVSTRKCTYVLKVRDTWIFAVKQTKTAWFLIHNDPVKNSYLPIDKVY